MSNMALPVTPEQLYDQVSPVAGRMVYREEALCLYRAAQQFRGGLALEIGSFKGLSTVMLVSGLANGTLISIDPHEGVRDTTSETPPEDFTLAAFHSVLRSVQMDELVAVLPTTSLRAIGLVRRLLHDRMLDLLFIDGSHRYEDVLADLRLYVPLLKQGGTLVMDDLGYGTVGKAWSDWGWQTQIQPMDLRPWGITDGVHKREHEGCIHKMFFGTKRCQPG